MVNLITNTNFLLRINILKGKYSTRNGNHEKERTHMKRENIDVNDEYVKICLYEYCREHFRAIHMNQLYCPEKDGIENYCKNRQKRINDNRKKEANEKQKNSEVILTPVLVAEPILPIYNTVLDAYQKKSYQRDLTIKFIIARIGFYKFVDVEIALVESFGIDLTGYDFKKILPDQNGRTMLIFGSYGIIWIEKNLFRLINLTQN